MPEPLYFLLSDHAIKLGLAVVLGGVIGLEREASDKPAGLRTNILICIGSTLMMILSIEVAHRFAETVADPGRIAQGVITGIGFLGAGTILHSRGAVTGLTTAATTWAVAGIGLALGSGLYLLAFATCLLILGVLWVLGKLAHVWPNGKGQHCRIRIVCDEPRDHVEAVRAHFERLGVPLTGWSYRKLPDGHCIVVECSSPKPGLPALIAGMSAIPGIRSARSI